MVWCTKHWHALTVWTDFESSWCLTNMHVKRCSCFFQISHADKIDWKFKLEQTKKITILTDFIFFYFLFKMKNVSSSKMLCHMYDFPSCHIKHSESWCLLHFTLFWTFLCCIYIIYCHRESQLTIFYNVTAPDLIT